jgi:chorismate dehydratase
MQHRPSRTGDGSWTLLHEVHGEGFHAREGAWTQALLRYARECRVRERAEELSRAGATRLRLLDIGTGLGLNLAAALHELEGLGLLLEVEGFERDVRVPRAALELPPEEGPAGPFVARARAALSSWLDAGAPSGAWIEAHGLRLSMHRGDARTMLSRLPLEPRFDAVFLDPFSPKVEPALWEVDFLREIALRMAPEARLSTYAAGSAVRRALHAAGLQVGLGARVGAKREGTLASHASGLPPLEPRQARRLRRPEP